MACDSVSASSVRLRHLARNWLTQVLLACLSSVALSPEPSDCLSSRISWACFASDWLLTLVVKQMDTSLRARCVSCEDSSCSPCKAS